MNYWFKSIKGAWHKFIFFLYLLSIETIEIIMDKQAWWVEHQHQAVGLSQLFHNDTSAIQAWLHKPPEAFLPQLLDDGFCIDLLQQMLPLVEEKAIANHLDNERP